MPAAGYRSLLGFWLGGGGAAGFEIDVSTSLYPAIASSDRFVLYAIPDAVWNTIPVLTSVMRNIPITAMKGSTDITWKASTRYRRDNQREASRAIQSSATAHIDFELRPDAFNDLLAATIGSRLFQPSGLVGLSDVYVDALTQSFVLTGSVTWETLGVRPGMWVQTAGFFFAANNGIFSVVTVSGGFLGVGATTLIAESPQTTQSGSMLVGFRFDHARNGSTPRTFFLEGQYTDVGIYEQYYGMQPTRATFELRPRSLIQGTLDFVGAHVVPATTSVLDSAWLCAARPTPVFDTAFGILSLWGGGIPLSVPVSGFSLNVENSAEPLARLSQLTPYSIRFGPVTVTGTLQVYFASIALATQFLTGAPTSFTLHLQSERGDRWVLSLPFVTLLGADTSVEGRDRDVFISFQWEATVDPVRGFSISADLFPASTFTYFAFSTNVPPVEYFRMQDQEGTIWIFWITHAGELARALATEGFLLLDETPVNITTGTVPYWHQVTDELGDMWYLYPDTTGQLLMDTAPPAVGTGLVVGLGQLVRGVDHAVYRVIVRSWWENQIETVDVTWRNVPRVWYFWLDEVGLVHTSAQPLTYFPGMMALPIFEGLPPAYYIITDSVDDTLWYLVVSVHHPEYFRLVDQTDITWFFWLDEAGQLTHNTVISTEFADTLIEVAGGTAAYWHQITDELGGVWYIYPDTTGDLLITDTPPALGTGLNVGLGQQLYGQGYILYRVEARSTQEIAVVAFPRAEYFRLQDQTGTTWFFWLDMAQELTRGATLSSNLDEVPIDITGGFVPHWYQVADELGGFWYLYPDTTGELIQSPTPPPTGTGLDVGLGQHLRGQDHLLYRLEARSWFATSLVFIAEPSPEVLFGTTSLLLLSTEPAGIGVFVGYGIEVIATNRLLYRVGVTDSILAITLISSVCGV